MRTKKQIARAAVILTIAATSLSSCITLSKGAAISSNQPIGQKMGEAKSTIFLFSWSSKGEQNNLRQAAENGGIKNITHVEYINKSIFGGFVIERTTRVYGD